MRPIVATVGVVALAVVLQAPGVLSDAGSELGCGDLSPFSNFCDDGPVEADEGYTPDVHHNAQGSVGILRIELWQTQVGGQWTDLRWSEPCTFIVLEDGSSEAICPGPDPAENLLAGPVLMRCYMNSVEEHVPPSGPWGCEADVAA